MKKQIKKIAIVRLSALGDIVNSAVVLQFIKNTYPNVQIEWFSESVFAPLLQNHPLIDTIHSINLKEIKKEKSLSKLMQLIKKLKAYNDYDLVIDMQGLIKSAVVARLLSPNIHGFDKHSTRESLASLFYKTTSSIPYDANVIKRNCKVVADALQLEITESMLTGKEAVFPQLHSFVLPHNKPNIAFVIGASWQSKKYPKELVAKVCHALDATCHIIWGNNTEHEEAKWIEAHTHNATLAPKLSLEELVSFISNIDLVIGNDTGPTHIAWAQNIPSITLLGPTTSRMIGQTPKNIAIKSPSKVNILKIDKNDFSIKEIKPEVIIQHAKELLCNT
ncbi:MAG: lipopolysaccharide heptosyltransferase I [Epsilonproteobacteria bacterium]|nr:lipopolysaccharide heptosyltransferase I [Campylobacterota bacterium]